MRPNRRILLIVTMVGIVMTYWSAVRFKGDPQPVDPLVVALLQEGPEWYSQPMLSHHLNGPAAIYVVPGFQGADGTFEALRLDVKSGTRHGLSLPRPTFHLTAPQLLSERAGEPR